MTKTYERVKMDRCYICNAMTEKICENCKRPFCDSYSGVTVGAKDAAMYCKKCALRLFDVICKKCGSRFKTRDELEEHYKKHPIHRGGDY